MAVITASNLIQIADQNVSSKSTGSITPAANALLLCAISTVDNGGNPQTVSSVTGNGLTWVQVNTYKSGNNKYRLTIYRAFSGLSSSAGAVTVTLGGSASGVVIAVDQLKNIDRSGSNGSGAIVQTANNSQDQVASPLTVTLNPFAAKNNGTYGYVFINGTSTFTPGSNFSTLFNTDNGNGLQHASEFAGNNQTSVGFNYTSTPGVAATAIEIKAGIQFQGAIL